MTADNLVEAEVVTADGQIKTISHKLDADIFWALRGGGAGFGAIVTNFTFLLHPIATAFVGPIVYPYTRGPEVFRAFATHAVTAPREDSLTAAYLWGPPMADGQRGLWSALMPVYTGNSSHEGMEIIERVRGLVKEPLADMVREVTYVELQKEMEPFLPQGRWYDKFLLLEELSDEFIQTLHAKAQNLQPDSLVVIHAIGGAMSDKAPNYSPYPHRRALFWLIIVAKYEAETKESQIAWARDLHSSIEKFGVGGYANELVCDDRNERLFGENLERLKEVKAKWDPNNVFKGRLVPGK